MNKKATSEVWAVFLQLAVFSVLMLTIYSVSIGSIQGTDYEQKLHAIDRSLIAEAISAYPNGVMTLHSFSTADYKTSLEQEKLSVALPGQSPGISEQISIPSHIDVANSDITGRGIRWLRAENRLSLQSLTAQQDCPAASIEWSTLAIIGEDVLADGIEVVAQNVASRQDYNIIRYTRLSERRDEPFIWVALNPTQENVLVVGTGDVNQRLACLFANELENQGLRFITQREVTDQPQVRILLADVEDSPKIQDATRNALMRMIP